MDQDLLVSTTSQTTNESDQLSTEERDSSHNNSDQVVKEGSDGVVADKVTFDLDADDDDDDEVDFDTTPDRREQISSDQTKYVWKLDSSVSDHVETELVSPFDFDLELSSDSDDDDEEFTPDDGNQEPVIATIASDGNSGIEKETSAFQFLESIFEFTDKLTNKETNDKHRTISDCSSTDEYTIYDDEKKKE